VVPVARRNLFAEKGRFAISISGVAFAVLLVLVVLALYRGFSRTGETFELLPGALWIAQTGTTDPFHSFSLVPTRDLDSARSVSGVAGVVPVLVRQMAFAVDGHALSARVMALEVPAGLPVDAETRQRYLPEPGVLVVDRILADKEGLSEGDIADLGAVKLRIGEVQSRSAEAFEPFAFVSYADARRIFGTEGVVNFGMVILLPGADEGAIAGALEARLPGTEVFTKTEFATAIRKEIDESLLPIIGILVAIGFTVGAAVVGLTIYTATIERSREFGVMKAVGASGAFLYRIVASQSAMVTTSGFVFGLAGALAVARLAREGVPDFATEFRVLDIAAVLAGTVVMAFAASLVPVRRINSIDPALVFRA
jgi:putative ABC transport system permease protein